MPAAAASAAGDLAVAAALLFASAEAFRCWLLLRAAAPHGSRRGGDYWRLAAAGLALLALDELLGLHEAIGWAIASLGAPAPRHTPHWGDVVLAGYVLAAGAISLARLGELRRSPRAFALLAAGLALAALAVALDNTARAAALEESLELAGAALIAAGMLARRLEASRAPHPARARPRIPSGPLSLG